MSYREVVLNSHVKGGTDKILGTDIRLECSPMIRIVLRLTGFLIAAVTLFIMVARVTVYALPPLNEWDMTAFVSGDDGEREIYVADLVTGRAFNLTRNWSDDIYPQWSPDGNRIAFISNRAGSYQIYMMDSLGRGIEQLTDSIEINPSSLRWSPDGQAIAFMSVTPNRYALYLLDVKTGHMRQLLEFGTAYNTRSERNLFRRLLLAFDWSPDANSILFSSGDTDLMNQSLSLDGPVRERTSHPLNGLELFRFDVDTGEIQQLTDNDYAEVMPVWSLDGSRIAFQANRVLTNVRITNQADLYVMNVADSLQQRIGHAKLGASLSWTPDGTSIGFFAPEYYKRSSLQVIHIEDGSRKFNLYDYDLTASDWRP